MDIIRTNNSGFKSLSEIEQLNYERKVEQIKKEDSIKLQDIGVGAGRLYGCGIFLPHKSIDAVANFKED